MQYLKSQDRAWRSSGVQMTTALMSDTQRKESGAGPEHWVLGGKHPCPAPVVISHLRRRKPKPAVQEAKSVRFPRQPLDVHSAPPSHPLGQPAPRPAQLAAPDSRSTRRSPMALVLGM